MLYDLSPEGQVFITVIGCLAVAYFVLYQLLRPRTVQRMSIYDLGVTGAILLLTGASYWGTGTKFSLLVFETNWFIFTSVVTLLVEAPLMYWFVKRNNISW